MYSHVNYEHLIVPCFHYLVVGEYWIEGARGRKIERFTGNGLIFELLKKRDKKWWVILFSLGGEDRVTGVSGIFLNEAKGDE